LVTTLAAVLFLSALVVVRHFWRQSAARPERAAKLAQLRAALE
jgi:hypothetical protein